ncbi:hypothetical protein FOZ63_031799, partial [Perkinsus olseni]
FGTLLPDGHDDYPDNPQSLSKSAVRGLAEELCPEITDEEFEAKWEIIDADRSGSLEFDEFVEWMALDEFDIDDAHRNMVCKRLQKICSRSYKGSPHFFYWLAISHTTYARGDPGALTQEHVSLQHVGESRELVARVEAPQRWSLTVRASRLGCAVACWPPV